MTALFGALLAEWWPYIMAGLVAVASFLGIYTKGRSDQKHKTETEDLRNANEIRRDGAAARAGADTSRVSDGWRRD